MIATALATSLASQWSQFTTHFVSFSNSIKNLDSLFLLKRLLHTLLLFKFFQFEFFFYYKLLKKLKVKVKNRNRDSNYHPWVNSHEISGEPHKIVFKTTLGLLWTYLRMCPSIRTFGNVYELFAIMMFRDVNYKNSNW